MMAEVKSLSEDYNSMLETFQPFRLVFIIAILGSMFEKYELFRNKKKSNLIDYFLQNSNLTMFH